LSFRTPNVLAHLLPNSESGFAASLLYILDIVETTKHRDNTDRRVTAARHDDARSTTSPACGAPFDMIPMY
jgi:hypothetical protein